MHKAGDCRARSEAGNRLGQTRQVVLADRLYLLAAQPAVDPVKLFVAQGVHRDFDDGVAVLAYQPDLRQLSQQELEEGLAHGHLSAEGGVARHWKRAGPVPQVNSVCAGPWCW
jgi:hypothetical protein